MVFYLKKTIGIIGGDLRQRYVAEALKTPVVFFANESINEKETVTKCNYLSELFLVSDMIIVPIPFTRDNKHVFVKYCVDSILIDAFIPNLTKDHIIIGGPFTEESLRSIKEKNAKVIDITALETFKMKNAIPTAEGVIAEIIHKLRITIHESKGLILGYGHCGKRLANSLKNLGSQINIYTENTIEQREAVAKGYDLLHNFEQPQKYDYIVNTIPKTIMTPDEILRSTSLFIDITEAYQMDHDCFIKMRGIPGRFSPNTAGTIIGEIINDLVISITGEND